MYQIKSALTHIRCRFMAASFLFLGILFSFHSPIFAAGDVDPVRIACVGDSITYGYTATEPSSQSYPAQLQKLLGDNFVVENYGISGYTLMKKGDKSYWSSAQYTRSTTCNPDIVIIMLGTNDSKEGNWVHKEEFLSDLEELIEIYQDLSTNPTVYVCTSLRMPVEYEHEDTQTGLNNAVIENEIVPLQKQAAQDMGCTLIDANEFSNNEMTNEDFKDYAHPTELGYQKLANCIYSALTEKEVSMQIIDDTEFTYYGDEWAASSQNATEHYAAVTEENADSYFYEISFTGTRIQLYGHLSPNHGIVSYFIDDDEAVEVDSYAASRSKVSQLLFQASGLSKGSHTLTAVATGRKNASAANACIQVDCAKIFTESVCTCAIEDLVFADGTITIPWDQDSAQITLSAQYDAPLCELSAHEDFVPDTTYTLSDAEQDAVLNGCVLTVTKAGTVSVTVTVEIPQTDIVVSKTAVFTVQKQEAPKDPPKQTETIDSSLDNNLQLPITLSRPKLTLKKSGTKVKLSWKKDDQADGYIIQMKTGKGKYKKIAAKKASAVSHTKKKLKKGTKYTFQICSYKKVTDDTVYSAWSKAVKIKI